MVFLVALSPDAKEEFRALCVRTRRNPFSRKTSFTSLIIYILVIGVGTAKLKTRSLSSRVCYVPS